MGSFRNIQLSSYFFHISRFTFSKENLQRENSSYFKNAGIFFESFDHIYYRFTVFFANFTPFNVKTIYNTIKIRPKDFHDFVFFQNGCIIFNKYYFSSFSVFSMKLGFTALVFPKRLNIGNLVYVKVIIKVPFCLLNKFCLKIMLSFIR